MIWVLLIIAGFAGSFFALGALWVAVQFLSALLGITVLVLAAVVLVLAIKRLLTRRNPPQLR